MENILGIVLTGIEAKGKAVAEVEPHAVMPMDTSATPAVPVAAPSALAAACGEAMPPPPPHDARQQDGRATAPRTPTSPAGAPVLQSLSPSTHAIVSRLNQRSMGRPRIYADEAAASAAKKEKQAQRRADAGAEGLRRRAFMERVRVLRRKDAAAAEALVAAALASADPVIHSLGVQSLRLLRRGSQGVDDVKVVRNDAMWCDGDLDQWLSHVDSPC
tara:strand:+ start:200 stop:850 length:651 start_codon:yes stop_codon:yes gene_type:complete